MNVCSILDTSLIVCIEVVFSVSTTYCAQPLRVLATSYSDYMQLYYRKFISVGPSPSMIVIQE
jgi:hypothetical protein